MDGATIPHGGVNFVGLSYDPNWMPAFLVFEPNRKVFPLTGVEGVGFLIDVRGIISNMWFTNLMMCEPAKVADKVNEVCFHCYEDNPERINKLDDLEHWNITFDVERFRTSENEHVEGCYTMYFPEQRPATANGYGLFDF